MYQPNLKAVFAFLVICLFAFSACTKDVTETETTTPQKGWQKVGDVDIAAANVFTFDKEGKLYAASAEVVDPTTHPKTYAYSVYELDVTNKKMKKLGARSGNANLSTANTVGFMVNESIYFYFASNNTLIAYNTLTNEWSSKASIPNGYGEPTPSRFAIGGYAAEGKGYMFVGVINTYLQTDLVQLYEYDAMANTWTSVKLWGSSMDYAARGFRQGNSFYIMSNARKLYRYQLGGTSLENLGTTPSGKLAHSPFAVVKNNKAFIGTGGEFTLDSNGALFSDETSDETWTLDLTNLTWTKIENFGGGKRKGASAYLFNNNIYVLGGQAGNTTTKTVDAKTDLWLYTE